MIIDETKKKILIHFGLLIFFYEKSNSV